MKINKFVLSPVLLVLAIVVGCSSGGDSGGGDNLPVSTDSLGFPNVAGRYSFNTSAFNVSCSDGSTGTNPGVALNFDVFQSVNVITIMNRNAAGGIPGITLIDSTDTTGNVQLNSSFIVTQISTANVDGISGTVNLNYNQTGSFSSNGWSGTYTYTASSPSLGSCTFTSSFNGTKITAPASRLPSKSINKNNEFPIYIHDQFSIIGSSMGGR